MFYPVMNTRYLLAMSVFLLTTWFEWLYTQFRPDQNARYWLAASVGAFIIRFALPKLPIQRSIVGWFVGFALSCMLSPSFVKIQLFGPLEPVAVWGLVALIGDLILQVLAWLIRITQKVGGYAEENPGEALDETVERVERLAAVWVRIKAPLVDLVKTIFQKKS